MKANLGFWAGVVGPEYSSGFLFRVRFPFSLFLVVGVPEDGALGDNTT